MNNYFSNMTNGELSVFYSLWNQSAKTGMMKQDPSVTKAIEHYSDSSMVVMACERDMLLEIASRWQESITK